MRFEKHIAVTAKELLVDVLARHTDLSKTCIKDCMNKGAVWLVRSGAKEKRIRKAKYYALPADRVSLYYDESILAITPPQPTCIARESQYSIWNKPTNLLTQGSRYGDHCSLLRMVEQSFPDRSVKLIHRLDREANGLVLLAHGKAAAAALSKLFHDRKVEKYYRATVHGTVGVENEVLSISTHLDGKAAETVVKVVSHDDTHQSCTVDVQIKTGRFHQIRRHLSSIGHPLVGDRKNGSSISPDTVPLQLTAYRLSFQCPFTGRQKCYTLTKKDGGDP